MPDSLNEREINDLIEKLNLDDVSMFSNQLPKGTRRDVEDNASVTGDAQDGWIEIIDQKIVVRDPENGGNHAILKPKKPLKLKVNEMWVDSEITVTSADRIHWEVEDIPLFEITVSNDKLQAYFRLYSKEQYAWVLNHSFNGPDTVVSVKEDPDILLKTVHLNDVVAALERQTIRSNLDLTIVQLELMLPSYKPVLVARGKAPTPGIDARLEIYFSEQIESQFSEVRGVVNFRNHLHIPSVRKGDVIARKTSLVDGIAGYDVFGNQLVPEPPNDIIIMTTSSVELTTDGEIIALREGRPRVTGLKIKTFDISTSYIVSGNVDIKTGNIVFSGDVVVNGDVLDNMIIESLGNVYISGSVFNATITATGSIQVSGNVIGSKLYSGYFGVMFNRLYNTTKTLCERMEKLLTAAKMLNQALESRQQSVRYGQILLLLIESKFTDIIRHINDLLFVISNIQQIQKDDIQKLKMMSETLLAPNKILELGSYSFINSYSALLHTTYQEIAGMQEEQGSTRIGQCQNSEIKSNGDILIFREGVLSSQLFSTGSIVFKHEKGVCRGSLLEARESIIAKVVGGETGAACTIKAEKVIYVKQMFSGRVCVGQYCRDIFEYMENMQFNLSNLKPKPLSVMN